MSEEMKVLRDNTDRRFAILMTALQDFMGALQQERNRVTALLDIGEKTTAKTVKISQKKATFVGEKDTKS
jgi:hypothetical protein